MRGGLFRVVDLKDVWSVIFGHFVLGVDVGSILIPRILQPVDSGSLASPTPASKTILELSQRTTKVGEFTLPDETIGLGNLSRGWFLVNYIHYLIMRHVQSMAIYFYVPQEDFQRNPNLLP